MIQPNIQQHTAVYCRLARFDAGAMERQKETLLRFAAGQGYKDIVCYADNGASGLTFDRPAFAAMEREMAAGNIKAVIIGSVSRISRDSVQLAEWFGKCRESGAAVISMAGETIPDIRAYTAPASLAKGGGRE